MAPKTLFAAALAGLALATPALAEIEVHDAYARASTMISESGAAFMVIHNHGGPDDRLMSARADISERVELHTHLEDQNGVMRMVEVEDGFELPTDGEILMERGGHHVMFLGLNEPMEQGDTFPLTLVFQQAGEVTIDVVVDLARMPEGHGGHDHGSDS